MVETCTARFEPRTRNPDDGSKRRSQPDTALNHHSRLALNKRRRSSQNPQRRSSRLMIFTTRNQACANREGKRIMGTVKTQYRQFLRNTGPRTTSGAASLLKLLAFSL